MTLMPTVRFGPGDVIFEEGYPPDGAYFICSGEVEVSKIRNDSKTVLATLGENAIFGEMALIDSRPRSATVIATRETWCYHHNQDSFIQKLQDIDYSVRTVLEDLANTVRTNSRLQAKATQENHRQESTNQLELVENEEQTISPARTKESILNDAQLQKKVDNLDIFMRKVFRSLVNVAYK